MRIPIGLTVLTVILCLLVSSQAQCQSQDEAIRLFNQAKALHEKARTKADLETAVEKYEKALQIFIARNDLLNAGNTLNNLGAVYYGWGQYAKAADCHEKAREFRKNIGDTRGEEASLNNLGNVYTDWGQYAKGLDYYEKSLAIARKIGDKKGEEQTLNNLGEVYRIWSQYAKAEEFYDRSLAMARKIGDVTGEGLTLNNLGLLYYGWGQHAKAAEFYEKSMRIFERVGHEEGSRAAANNLGLVYKDLGKYAKATESHQKSARIAQKMGNSRGQGQAVNNLGIVYEIWGQYGKAVKSYEESLEIFRRIGDLEGHGQTLLNLGNVCQAEGQYAKALNYYEQALVSYGKIGALRHEGTALNNLGIVYQLWGQYGKAVDLYEKSLEIARKIGNLEGEGLALNGLGTVHADRGQYVEAAEFHEKSLDIKRKLGDVKGEGHILINLGKLYGTAGEYDKALECIQKGMKIYEEIGIPTKWPEDLIGNLYLDEGELEKAEPFIRKGNYDSSLGRLSLVKGDYRSATNAYQNLLKSAEQSRNVDDLFTAYAGLGISYEGIGNNPQAVENYKKAVALTEDLRSSLNLSERDTFFDVRIGGFYRTAPYEGLARVLVKMNRSVEAFKESEYTRARIFAESISKRGDYGGQDVPSDVRERDCRLTDQLAALSKKLQQAYEKGNTELITVLEPQVREAKKSLAAHVDSLRRQYPLCAATRYPQPMDLQGTSLKGDEWVLAYHVTDPGLVVYATKGKELVKALFKPVPRKEIENLVRRFREPLEMNPKDGPAGFMKKLTQFNFSTGKQLTDVLLGDVLSVFPPNVPILVIPDGPLGVLPFEALPLTGTGRIQVDKKIPYVTATEFFGDRNPLCYCQSVTALTLARTLCKQKRPVERLLVLADPIFQMKEDRAQKGNMQIVTRAGAEARLYQNLMAAMEEGELGNVRFSRLALAGRLAEDLKGLYSNNSEVYIGFDASKEGFLGKLGSKLDGYDKIVFATHGYFGKDLPGIKEPVLVLTLVPPGTDGFLRMSEVAGLKLNADVVALTACQSGLGRIISGEGTMGMGRAFQYAGAKSVLMSLWSVAEKSSVDLVEGFFKHLKEGKNKLEALKLARDEIRKAGYDHPFFWAPFILVGDVN